MNSDTFIQGLSRVLNCSKVHVTITGLVTTWFAVRYATADLPPTQRASLWVAFIGAVAVQLREIVNAWTEEDVAQVVNQPKASTPQSADEAPAVPPPSLPPAVEFPNPPTTDRSPDMPSRTKFPSILIGFLLIALFTGSGCQTPPQLTTYREGLHQVDEPLYQAHLLLMDDAVKANLRTDADRQVVQQGVAAARALYQQSKALDGAP